VSEVRGIKIGQLDAEIRKNLKIYGKDVTDQIKEACDEVTEEMAKRIKDDARAQDFHNNDYIKAMKTKTHVNFTLRKINMWYLQKPYYRDAHLLEYGHAKVGGGRTRAFPHIKKNEEWAKKEFEERVKKIIRGG
jgi:hypothetical protein